MKKLRVGVLRGGPSSEYAVSLATGGAVLAHLPRELFEAEDIFLSKEGEWHRLGIPYSEEEALRGIDVLFNALHGTYGENGGVQKIAERFGVPYTGSRAVPGALALFKPKTRSILEGKRIMMPRAHVTYRGADIQKLAQMVFTSFTPPWIIKPVNEGSSIGIHVAYSAPDLVAQLENSFRTRETMLIEEYVRGEEASVLLVEGKEGDLYALPPVRIARNGHIFTHEEKCIAGEHTCELPFSEQVLSELEETAKKAYSLLGLRHYGRADFIITPAGRIYLLEMNALPSLAPHTPTAHALAAAKTNLPEFLEHLITIARK